MIGIDQPPEEVGSSHRVLHTLTGVCVFNPAHDDCPEPACLGGALLAGYGMGWNTPQDWPCHINAANLIPPRTQVHEIYQAQNK
jgi:hypothetical protein